MRLSACPFCQGPPVVFTANERSGFEWHTDETYVEGHVFCHECGARGPVEEAWLEGPSDVPAFAMKVATAWNERNARHIDLYHATVRDGRYEPEPALSSTAEHA